MLSGGSSGNENNVSMVDGKQIVTIIAKGKYLPRTSTAAAGVPTTIAVKTNGTFDCTAALTIPALNYQATLPPTGITNIELPAQKAGTSVQGRCGMGMYTFAINFM